MQKKNSRHLSVFNVIPYFSGGPMCTMLNDVDLIWMMNPENFICYYVTINDVLKWRVVSNQIQIINVHIFVSLVQNLYLTR